MGLLLKGRVWCLIDSCKTFWKFYSETQKTVSLKLTSRCRPELHSSGMFLHVLLFIFFLCIESLELGLVKWVKVASHKVNKSWNVKSW